MLRIRQELSDRFFGLLTPQDAHAPRLHVTIQNKVSPQDAKALQRILEPAVEPRDFRFTGLSLHIYRGAARGSSSEPTHFAADNGFSRTLMR